MTAPPPSGHSMQGNTRDNTQGFIKRLKSRLRPSSANTSSLASSAPNVASVSPSPSVAPGAPTITTSTGSTPAPKLAVAETVPDPGMASKIKYTTVASIESTLQALHLTAGVVPSLKPAIAGLVDCLDVVQAATSSIEEYNEIISNLGIVATSLKEYLGELGLEDSSGNPACTLIASNIEKEVMHIKEQQGRSMIRRALESIEDKEDVMKCYRRVEMLFQQLQSNIYMQTLKNTNRQHLMSLLDRLYPVADARYDSRYSTTIRRHGCTKETRKQIKSELEHWAQDPNGTKVYWMNGMAGTGKTTIAYSLCEWLETQKRLGASFFCSRLSPWCRNVDSIIPTIAYELACYSPAFRAKLGKVLEEDPNTSARDVDKQFRKLIHGPMMAVKDAMPHGVVVVIDALDECEDPQRVELILQVLLRLGTNLPVKYFVASRPEPAILEKMLGLAEDARDTLHLHDIEQSVVEEDIKKYLEEGLGSMSPPPDVKQIDQLARLAGKLFIYAATVTRYILPGAVAVNSAARLKAVLAAGSSATNREGSAKTYKQLDELYATVLGTPLDENMLEPDEIEVVQLVLWTVVCAKEPMTIPTLAAFLSLDEMQVLPVVKALRSVLHVSEGNGLVSTLHASFPDYMLNRERSKKYYCDPFQHNGLLARRCLDVMKVQLRFNICGLESSCVFDKDIVDLEQRIASNISCELSYSCLYWGEHLHRTGVSAELWNKLVDFFRYRLLLWMEVLSLKQRIGHGENVLSQVLDWLPAEGEPIKLQDFTYDARNFLTTFASNPTSQSTPHIYVSALPSTSKQSHVWKAHQPRMQGLLEIEGAVMEAIEKSALATWVVGSGVHSIARSSDGKRIASGSSSGEISIWDISSGTRNTDPLNGHQGQVWSVAFSPDNTRIASGSGDHTIRLWDALNGNRIGEPLCGHTGGVTSVSFSPDGTCLASGSTDCTIRTWDARTGTTMGDAYYGHDLVVLSVAFSPNGEHLASGSADRTIRVWNWRTGVAVREPIEGHTSPVCSVTYSSDGLRLASGSWDCSVRVWDMPSGTLLAGPFCGHSRGISSVSFSPDNTRIVSGSWDGKIRVCEAESGDLLSGPFEGHSGTITAALFTSDGTRILSGSDDGTIRLWDVRYRTRYATKPSGHTGGINSIVFSPDGARVASGSEDGTICVWDTHGGKLVTNPFVGHTDKVNSVTFSPDGARIVSGSSDYNLHIWDASTGMLLIGPIEGHSGSVRSVAFSPDGRQIASGSDDRTIRLWNSNTGALVAEPFKGHSGWVASISFSPDGGCIVSGSSDNTVRMWDASDGTALWTSNAHTDAVNCVSFSLDGARVASASWDKTILVMDPRDGTVLHGPFGDDISFFTSAAFSPDGTRIVSGSWDKTICVWDVESGAMVAGPLEGHVWSVSSVAFSPDGARIVSGSDDATIRFWDVAASTQRDATSFSNLTVTEDGWLTNSNSQLMFWVPPELRHLFEVPSLSNSLVIGRTYTIRGDHSTLFLGERWGQCYNAS